MLGWPNLNPSPDAHFAPALSVCRQIFMPSIPGLAEGRNRRIVNKQSRIVIGLFACHARLRQKSQPRTANERVEPRK